MRVFVFIILSLIVVAALLVLRRWPPYRPRVHTIDAVDLFRLADARRGGPSRRRGRARWAVAIVIAILLVALFWHLSRGG